MLKNNQNKILLIVLSVVFILFSILVIGKFSTIGLAAIFVLIIVSILFFYILKYPFLGLLLTVVTLPFERIPTVDVGFMTLKMDQFFAGMTIISCILLILTQKKKFKTYAIGWPITFFVLVSFISTFQAVDFTRAIMVFIFIIFMIAISFCTTQILDSEDKIKQVIKWLFIITIFITLFGLYQFFADIAGFPITLTGLKEIYTKSFMGFPRIHSFSMEPLYFANFLFIPLGVALSLYIFKDKTITNSNRLMLIIFLIILNIVLGISRGAYVALVFMVLFFIVFALRKIITIKNVVTAFVIIILVLSGTCIFLKQSRPDALAEFTRHASLGDFAEGESVQKRLRDFSKAVEFWHEKPIIGIGPGNYGPRYKDYPSHDEVTDWEIVNNQYLETLAETGILGLILLLIIIFILFWRSYQTLKISNNKFHKAILLGLTASLFAILVQYNFFSTIYIMHIWILFGLLVAVQNLILVKKQNT